MRRLVLILAVAAAVPAHAQEGVCSGAVVYGEETPLRLMRVEASAPRVHFVENRSKARPSCPAPGEACQRRGFVVPGDEVLVQASPAPFACASYIAPSVRRMKGVFAESNGFLPPGALREVTTGAPAREAWLGKWARNAEADIHIVADAGGKLVIEGEATLGGLDPERVRNGAVRVGSLNGTAMPRGNLIALGEGYDGTKPMNRDADDCQARLRLYGRYLVAEDNGQCGGLGVSFTGLYVRLP